MKCPHCDKSMKKLQWSLLRGQKSGGNAKHDDYDRTLYVCEADDVWVTVEEPATNSSSS